MKPANLRTKIFLDGGDPEETREIIELLGFLDGQTTNPTLIAKNPEAKARLARGGKFTEKEIYDFYRGVVKEISVMIPDGSVSIEVYADAATRAEDMLKQGREFFAWVPNAHIKYPTTKAGLEAAQQSVKEGLRVNMTLCFSQEQAAAVYAATRGAKKGQVFVSPFVGRLDDKGENGMELIANIVRMYKEGDGHTEILTASVRTLEHFLYALALKSDIITAPAKTLREWAEKEMPVPPEDYVYNAGALQAIAYQSIALTKPWQEYNIAHALTDAGIAKFAEDWNGLIASK
ncbi:transaldolase [Candidatus Uhrbacteria bacterium]|nr:transaldolase [Candidatus Uhrbacteria bacterium]